MRWKFAAILLAAICVCSGQGEEFAAARWIPKQAGDIDRTHAKTVSFWDTEADGMLDAGQDQPAELGMKFSSDVPAQLTGMRFYKFVGNAGPHVANVWSSDGTLLLSVEFTNETASGWQQVNFKESVPLQPNEAYIVSYHENNGHYAYAKSYFNKPLNVPPLHAPAGAGVFAYGTASAFPQQSFQNNNYWVDPEVLTVAVPKSLRTVSLSWKASTTPNVTYNVYRKTSRKEEYKTPPIASGLKVLTYDDHVMAARGDKFYYVVRSVDHLQHESMNSNEADVTIPSRGAGKQPPRSVN